jgi:arabinose-5-phosphate isomerase
MDILNSIRGVISLEIEALENLLQSVDTSFEAAVSLMLQTPGKIVVSGMGKSGLIARKIAATLSSTGTSAVFLHPSEALHGDLGVISKGDTVLLIGKSGESDEMIGMLPVLKKLECRIIAITANRKSTLATHSAVVLYTPIEQEACSLNLAPTCSTTAALAVGDALAVTLMKIKGFSRTDFALFHPAGRIGKRLLYLVDDLMKGGDENPIVHIDEKFDQVLVALTRGRVNGVSVIDDEGNFQGLITGFDLRRVLMETEHIRALTAREIMFTEPVTITAGVYAVEAYKIMKDHPKPLLLLPVLKDRKVVGIITMQDMVRAGL